MHVLVYDKKTYIYTCSCASTICVCVPVSEWGNNQSVSVPEVFIAELELGVTDVDVTVSVFIIPAMA